MSRRRRRELAGAGGAPPSGEGLRLLAVLGFTRGLSRVGQRATLRADLAFVERAGGDLREARRGLRAVETVFHVAVEPRRLRGGVGVVEAPCEGGLAALDRLESVALAH